MTLVIAINGVGSIWMLADRRLSYRGRPPKDDARKIMLLSTKDATAILGYAGLGATALGTEPSDWMSAVLRGRNMPLEASLGAIADAMKRQLPRHMLRIRGSSGPSHNVLVTALVGDEPRFYSIDLGFLGDRRQFNFRYTRHTTNAGRVPRIVVAGTGGLYLSKEQTWVRPLLSLVRDYDRKCISARPVADYLARLNNRAYLGIRTSRWVPTASSCGETKRLLYVRRRCARFLSRSEH